MAQVKVQCSGCRHEFYMDEYKRVSCPQCGRVIVGPKADSASSGPCLVATSCVSYAGLPDDCAELNAARFFRDNYIKHLPGGQGEALIAEYYEFAPQIIAAIEQRSDKEELYRGIYRQLMINLDLIKAGKEEQAFENACMIFYQLKAEHLE